METALGQFALITKTLGHPARLRILAMLRSNRLSVCQIASVLGVAASTASGYLLELRRADLVTEQRRGKWVYYQLTTHDRHDALVRLLLLLIASDPQVQQDGLAARTLNGTPPDMLCAAVSDGRAALTSDPERLHDSN
jgi:DNA-binding transcriptional ArsR family regulator